MTKETLKFTVSPSIIRHLIERQAGTLDKAILELITNGVDAGASRIDVTFRDDRHITVSDNGRGFQSREEVEKHFGDFGFDHDTEEERRLGRINGRFGMGRSQIYGFGRSSWRTHTFQMDVDIRSEKDLAFDLTTIDGEPVDGCSIDVELYSPTTTVEKERVRRTLKEHVQYAPSAIYVDGERVNKSLDTIKWSAESERLLFLHKPTSTYGLEVHNMGIYVSRYTQSNLGVSGVVVSKIPHSFKVTMSRTDVHRSCELWAEMLELIKPFKEKQRRRKTLTDQDRMGIARDWLYGELEDTAVMKRSRLFKTVKGNYMTINQVHQHGSGLIAIENKRYDRVGEAIHNSHAMTVLARDFYDWIDASDDQQVVTALETMSRLAYGERQAYWFRLADYAAARDNYDGALIAVEPKKWTKLQKAQIASLKLLADPIATAVKYGQSQLAVTRTARRLTLGDSDTALAWTDGRNYICLKRGYMTDCFEQGMDGIIRLIGVLVHEQLHTESDMSDEHDHPPEFFEAFENVLVSRTLGLFSLATLVLKRYDRERTKLGLSRSMHVAKMLDQVKVDDAEAT
jgi:hypothetical protein